jgi:choline dehydrogenase-like flavoprotein
LSPPERADVVVIGAGPAGGALSLRLAEHGAKVVCLEQGGWVKAEEFPSARRDYEANVTRGPFAFFPNLRRRWEDYPVTTEGLRPDQILMFNGVGGSTVHWEGHFPRMHPSDFRVHRLDGAADDWPIGFLDLEAFYDLNDRNVGVSGITGDPANPRRSARQTPPLPIGGSGAAIVRGLRSWGGIGGRRTTRFSRATTMAAAPATTAAAAISAVR